MSDNFSYQYRCLPYNAYGQIPCRGSIPESEGPTLATNRSFLLDKVVRLAYLYNFNFMYVSDYLNEGWYRHYTQSEKFFRAVYQPF